ncbi:unnamed protein product [Lactuca saligna]|uniref:Uncharacterized protein n=1 Tax=Lactuca saligna TaxID=75948 RepID=A0AA35Y3V9_LACSI|nr:unnamed protein product [Lactuca saligna]
MTPTKVMKHRSHNKFHRSMECKSLMVELGQSGLKPSMVKKAINAMKTSNEADVTSKQCVDVLFEQRKQHKGKEFYGLIKHFQDKTLVDNDQEWVNSETIEEFEATWEVIRCKYKLEMQFDKAVVSRRAAEEDEDFKTMNSRSVLSSVHPIEAKADMMPQLSIRDPLGPTTTKGHPKVASRIKSPLEAPKKRTCSYCQGLGHYASSCSKRKADESIHEKEK